MSLYYGYTNKRVMYDYQNATLIIFTQTTTTYVLTRLMKRWRSTRARVERTMMVVHIVPRAQNSAAKETAGSTRSSHSESTHHSWWDLFVSLFLSLPGWISNIGGLVNPRLEKMTWCITKAEHSCTTNTVTCAHLLCMIQAFIISSDKHLAFASFWGIYHICLDTCPSFP